MIRILRRAWRYFGAVLEGKLEELADPRIQIGVVVVAGEDSVSMRC